MLTRKIKSNIPSINNSVKFTNLLERAIKSTKLQRVRIKVDPMWSEKLGIVNCPYYEGYILQECPGSNMDFKVFIVNTPAGIDPVQTVNKAHLEPVVVQPPEGSEKFEGRPCPRLAAYKEVLAGKFKEMNKDMDCAEVQQVMKSNDIGFIETFLKQMGFSDEDILGVYRKTLLN